MNPNDPFEAFEESIQMIDRVRRDIEKRVPPNQVAEVRAKLESLRGRFADAQTRLREAMTQQTLDFRKELEARLKKAEAATLAKQRDLAASGAGLGRPEFSTPPPRIELLDADSLGRMLLTELGLLARPAAPAFIDPGSISDDLPAMDEELPTVEALSVPLLPERARDVPGFSPQARELVEGNLAMGAFVATLLQTKRFADIGRLLTAELPVREAVWWVGLCIQRGRSDGQKTTAAEKAALRAAVAWVLDPSLANQEKARSAGESTESASHFLARTAGQKPFGPAASRGGENAAAQLIDRALQRTCPKPGNCPEAFAMLGLGVAERELSWKKLVVTPGTVKTAAAVRVSAAARPAYATGHNLGKQMLLDLNLVGPPRVERKTAKASDEGDEDFLWETSGEWNSLGM